MKSILKKLSYVFTSNILNALSKFIVIIFIVRFLDEYYLGIYTFALAITAPITLLFNMKLRSYIVSNDGIDFKRFTTFRQISNIFSLMTVLVLTLLCYIEIASIVILTALIKIIDINSEYYQAFPNKEKKFEIPSKLMILKIIISTSIFLLILYITNSLTLSLIGQMLFLLLYLQFEKGVNLSLVDVKKYTFDIQLKDLLIILFPLGLVQALLSFSANIPKYLLEQFGTFEAIGIFSGTLYVITIFNMVMNTLNQTLLPYLKDIYSSSIKKFNKFLNVYFNIISLVVGLIFIGLSHLFGAELLEFLFSKEFANHSYLLYVYGFIISFVMSGWTYDSSLLISGALRLQPYLLTLVSLITLGVGIVLLKELGLLGAALTLLAFHMLNTISKAIYYNYHIKSRRKYV